MSISFYSDFHFFSLKDRINPGSDEFESIEDVPLQHWVKSRAQEIAKYGYSLQELKTIATRKKFPTKNISFLLLFII